VLAGLRHSFHLARVGYVLMREGVFALVPDERVPGPLRPAFWLARLFARRDAGVQEPRGSPIDERPHLAVADWAPLGAHPVAHRHTVGRCLDARPQQSGPMVGSHASGLPPPGA
jgi:hypothetical protein